VFSSCSFSASAPGSDFYLCLGLIDFFIVFFLVLTHVFFSCFDQVNLLTDRLEAFAGGWWLLRARAEHARHGYSSQDMEVWGAGMQCVAVSRQLVAIYA
jgi:hypothetical protein